MVPALIACCSKAGLAVARALGRQGIPVYGLCFGRNQIGRRSRFMHDAFTCTDPSDDEQAFIEQVLQIGSRWDRPVLIPSDDGSLVAICRHAQRLGHRFRLCSESWSIVQRLIEKHFTYEIAGKHGVPAPALQLIESVEQTVAFANRIGYPCLIKPSVGHLFFKRFRKKMLMVGSEAELRKQLAIAGTGAGQLMLCEFIPGDDTCGVNYNSFAIDGEPYMEFTAQKVRNKPQLIGFPTAVRSVLLPEVRQLGRRMLGALGLSDFSCMEFKRDPRDGTYKLMEVNARHNYSGALASACGINFPLASYRRALNEPVLRDCVRQREDVLWIDEERDASHIVRALLSWRQARGVLEPLLLEKVFAVTRLDDPLPTWDLVKSSLRTAARQRSSAPSVGASLSPH